MLERRCLHIFFSRDADAKLGETPRRSVFDDGVTSQRRSPMVERFGHDRQGMGAISLPDSGRFPVTRSRRMHVAMDCPLFKPNSSRQANAESSIWKSGLSGS